jgi:hypothetical protein
MTAPDVIRQLVERFDQHRDAVDKARHDKMVSLVASRRMLSLHKNLKSTHNPQEADHLTREVESVDKAIDIGL